MLRLTPRQSEVASWPCPEGMHPLLHRLLSLRGVGSREEARAFLHPGREDLRDPYLLSDMQAAVDIIRDAVKKDQRICVYGDYDVDGVCASAILTLYLKELGARCGVYLPSRHTEGYGLNADAVDFISLNYELLITVDCGITAFELVERALSKGMRVIVTDHHKPGERLPGCPTVNPLLGGYPFGYLCGTGVAFQLVTALFATFDEAFDHVGGTGWNNSGALRNTDETGWTTAGNVYRAPAGLRLGTSDKTGCATTREIVVSNDIENAAVVISFLAASYTEQARRELSLCPTR